MSLARAAPVRSIRSATEREPEGRACPTEMSKFCLTVTLIICFLSGIAASGQVVVTDLATERTRGIALYNSKSYGEAAAVLKKFVKSNAADGDGWYYLGLSLIQTQDPKEASKALEKATKLRPNFAPAHAALAYSMLLRNKSKEATSEANAALELEPGNFEANYILGVVALRSGAEKEALRFAEAAIKIQPKSAPAYLLKSQALARFFSGGALLSGNGEIDVERKDRFGEAAAALERYLELNPNDENKDTWTAQLESLHFYMKPRDAEARKNVFTGKNVEVKARVLSKPEPSYTEQARQRQVEGTVVLRGVFSADGTVKYLLVIQSLPFGLTEQSLAAARKIKFVPATKDGRPVSTYIQLEYNFNLF